MGILTPDLASASLHQWPTTSQGSIAAVRSRTGTSMKVQATNQTEARNDMRQIFTFSPVVLCLLTIPAHSVSDDEIQAENFEEQGRVCITVSDAIGERTSRGDILLVLGVTRYAPNTGDASILIRRVSSGEAPTVELARVAMYPGGPFTATEMEPARRFSIPLREDAETLQLGDEACFEVTLVDFNGQPASGALHGFIEISGKPE